jgi:hypothetical protein
MDIYNLGNVARTTDGRADFYGFSIVGVSGRPVVSFSFETKDDAEAAYKVMQAIVAKAKLITPS